MNTQYQPPEGTQKERLAAYFLSTPPMAEQSPAQKREYLQHLHQLGQLERLELRQSAGATRPLVWGNPATLIQALLSAMQRQAAKLGQPILIFPARETAIGTDTLFHPRILSIALCDLLYRACTVSPRQPVWVRLQEQKSGLSVAITAIAAFADAATLAGIKECTKLHNGSLVHCDQTVIFTCGQEAEPPNGVRLYGCPTEEDLLSDTLSPVWTVFYAGLYSTSSPDSGSASSSGSGLSSKPMSPKSSMVSSAALDSAAETADKR